jgi:hypothetical protein
MTPEITGAIYTLLSALVGAVIHWFGVRSGKPPAPPNPPPPPK